MWSDFGLESKSNSGSIESMQPDTHTKIEHIHVSTLITPVLYID